MEWLRRKGSAGRQWSNGEITARVEGAFSHYGPLESVEHAFIHVRTEHRVVELRGNVASRINKMKAEEIAASVPGVLEVNSKLIADPDLETQIARRLAEDATTGGQSILVRCLHGVAYLEGEVAYGGVRDEASKVTRGVKGVREVVNKLAIRD